MYKIDYSVIEGTLPITVSLSGSTQPDNVHSIYEDGVFIELDAGDYILVVTDSVGCVEEFPHTIIGITPTPTPTPTPTFVPQNPITIDLRAYYKFDETSGVSASDATGNGYTGTLDTYTFGSGGKIGYGVNGGLIGYGVSCGQAFSPGALGAFSVNGWYNFSTINLNNKLWGKNGANGLIYSYLTSSGELWFVIAKDLITYRTTVQWGNFDTTTDVYKMITWTYDGSGNASGLKLYLNGTEVTANRTNVYDTLGVNNPDSTEVPFIIGGNNQNDSYQTQGYIDEFGVWHRELPTSQITELYNNSYGLQYPFL